MPMMPRRPTEASLGPFEAAWRGFMAQDGTESVFIVENQNGLDFNGGGKTISRDALTVLREQMTLFVASRITRRLNEGKSAPRVRVTIKVDFE